MRQALAEIGSPSPPPRDTGNARKDEAGAAASLSAEDQSAMIETMVAGLDERLRRDPNDAEGWMRLIRSYVVLGRTDQARDALKRGLDAFGSDSDKGKEMTAFAASLGLATME